MWGDETKACRVERAKNVMKNVEKKRASFPACRASGKERVDKMTLYTAFAAKTSLSSIDRFGAPFFAEVSRASNEVAPLPPAAPL